MILNPGTTTQMGPIIVFNRWMNLFSGWKCSTQNHICMLLLEKEWWQHRHHSIQANKDAGFSTLSIYQEQMVLWVMDYC